MCKKPGKRFQGELLERKVLLAGDASLALGQETTGDQQAEVSLENVEDLMCRMDRTSTRRLRTRAASATSFNSTPITEEPVLQSTAQIAGVEATLESDQTRRESRASNRRARSRSVITTSFSSSSITTLDLEPIAQESESRRTDRASTRRLRVHSTTTDEVFAQLNEAGEN